MIQVVESRKKLVIPGEFSEKVCEFIPHAKPFTFKGTDLSAVNHGIDEVKMLRNLGVGYVPSPIRHYYKWPAMFKPMSHQVDTSEFFINNRRCICLNSPGTGKTMSALWAADYLLNLGEVKKVLIVAPLSTLKTVWGQELMRHMPHRSFAIITGSLARKKRLLADESIKFAITNHDGLTTHMDLFEDFDLHIYDEATALKTPNSIRYKKYTQFTVKRNIRLWLLTGTPISQKPTDAWTLAKLILSPTVPRSFTTFREMTMQRITQFRSVPRPGALEICKNVLQPSIRYDLSECIDLPETVYVTRTCELTQHQNKAFATLLACAMLEDDNISAPNAAVLYSKLLQVCTGVAYDSDGNDVLFDDSNRLELLIELLDEIGDKVIVWVPFRGVQNRLEKVLQGKGYDVAVVHGDVPASKRGDIFNKFQNTDEIDILLAHPKVASHGLTLTRAKHAIWYVPIYSLESYEQANARIRRLTTKGRTMVFHIASSKFEQIIYKRLEQHQKVLSDFLNLVRGINE